METNENKLKVILPERINGLRKTQRGVYVPTSGHISKILRNMVPSLEDLPEYVSQGDEAKKIDVARKNKKSVLISGPTGIGKSLLVRRYAAENKLPLLVYVANEDASDWKMRGSQDLLVVPFEDEKGEIRDIKVKTFTPAQVSLAAMAEEPVVLFVDELHKMRQGVTSLLHSLINPTERTLYSYDLTGEDYKLHPETLVVGALNPSYGEGGIDRLDAALRRRWATIPLEMPNEKQVLKIVMKNVGELDGKLKGLVAKLISIQARIYRARKSSEGNSPSAVVGEGSLDTQTLSSIIEVPSPASIVETVRDIQAGLPALSAIEMNMIDTIVTDFGHARAALVQYVKDMIPASLLK